MRLSSCAAAVLATVLLVIGFGAGPASAAHLDLHHGSHGTHVHTLETRLHKLHLLARSDVDRRFWAATTTAVKRFQRQHHRAVTGRVNQSTWNLIARAVTNLAPKPQPIPVAPPPPTILGHRGARVPGVTENTLASMRYAAASADVLEFDLQLTADGEFVLMHDDTLDRTTSCTGPVAAQTAEYLRENCTTDDDSGPIPTFAEVAQYAAYTNREIAPEVKDNTPTDSELAAFVDVIHENGLASRTFVQSFHPEVFPRIRSLDSELRFVYLTGPSTPPVTVQDAGASIAGLSAAGLTAAVVASYRKAGLLVWAWTASTSTQLDSLWKMAVDGVFTDIPVAARAMYHPE